MDLCIQHRELDWSQVMGWQTFPYSLELFMNALQTIDSPIKLLVLIPPLALFYLLSSVRAKAFEPTLARLADMFSQASFIEFFNILRSAPENSNGDTARCNQVVSVLKWSLLRCDIGRFAHLLQLDPQDIICLINLSVPLSLAQQDRASEAEEEDTSGAEFSRTVLEMLVRLDGPPGARLPARSLSS